MIRKRLLDLQSTITYKIIFIESICTIDSLVKTNLEITRLTCPDYQNWKKEEVYNNLNEKIKIFEKNYESLSKETDGDNAIFIKFINEGQEINIRNVRGYYESKLLSFMINIHTGRRPIYFSRHGESVYNTKGWIGGDSELSPLGEKYGVALAKFFEKEKASLDSTYSKWRIYCSTLKRTIQTAKNLIFISSYTCHKSLDEINVGLCDSITYEEFAEKFPEEAKERARDKLKYRYPRGESYLDMIHRIEHVIYELERQDGPAIIIGHQGILRALYGYYASIPIEKIPTLDFPLHTVIKFTPHAYGFQEERFIIDPETHYVEKEDLEKMRSFTDIEKLLDNSKEYNYLFNIYF